MDFQFRLHFKRFSSQSFHSIASKNPGYGMVLPFLSGMIDNNHSIVLRGLLTALEGNPEGVESQNSGELCNAPHAYREAAFGFEQLKEECGTKFTEFKEKWKKRLTPAILLPFLQKNQWVIHSSAGFALAGKGARRESKMLYLQTLHDMSSDCERLVSGFSGTIFRLQQRVGASWHEESVRGNRSKLLPAFEAGLRPQEFEIFKRFRLALSDAALEKFTDNVNRWDKRNYSTELALFQRIAWPWFNPSINQSGFEGFMVHFSAFAESFTMEMIRHYETKWRLFLRGMERTLPFGSVRENVLDRVDPD